MEAWGGEAADCSAVLRAAQVGIVRADPGVRHRQGRPSSCPCSGRSLARGGLGKRSLGLGALAGPKGGAPGCCQPIVSPPQALLGGAPARSPQTRSILHFQKQSQLDPGLV